MAQAAQAAFLQGTDGRELLEQVRQENMELQRERAMLARQYFEEGFLDDSPICDNCGGSGYVGSTMCECLRELCRQEQKKEISVLSGGKEHFISLVYGDSLIGYARLRVDDSDTATIRELKVFGKIASIGEQGKDWQHRGFGRELVAEAERIALASGASRIRVTSGVGVREYYASLGFKLERPHMAKDLT
jgi:GNAT superfamily N-acetyltransferase